MRYTMAFVRSSALSLLLFLSCQGFSQDAPSLVVGIDPIDGLTQCPGNLEPVRFEAMVEYEEGYEAEMGGPFQFAWAIGEYSYSGPDIAHAFPDPGAYPVHLRVTDGAGVEAYAIVTVQVGTVPFFSGTMVSAQTACAGENISLFGTAQPQVWTGFQTEVRDTVLLADGAGEAHASSLYFDVFGEGLEVLSADDIDRVCVTIEHIDQSHLRFELESPQGQRLLLKRPEGPPVNLGEPVVWDEVTPGRGYAYCFSPQAQFGRMSVTTPRFHEYTDQAGNYYFNAPYMPAGSYTPDEDFNGLAGSTLNGTWTLYVEDTESGDKGHFLGWSLFFDESFYPDSLIFSTEIVSSQWFRNGSAISGNPASISIAQDGIHTFLFAVTDNFGCTYDTTFTTEVLPLPQAEIVSEFELPVCEGDSTIFTVYPINHSGLDWNYQWQVNGTDMPDRIHDTLLVKQVALYTVVVEDPSTGCIAFVDKDFSDQNCDLTIPNVFTPNGDGINDVFEILNLEHYPNAQMVIFNRWGERVFEHPDYYNNWWDGGNAPDGVYFYVLRYSRKDETKYTEGSVTIIR